MTIQHTVVFSLSHPEGSDAEADFIATGRRALTGIPGVTAFVVNRQVSPTSELRWQFSMEFADEAAYQAYNVHPVHVDFVESRWKSEVSAFQEYDFVVQPA